MTVCALLIALLVSGTGPGEPVDPLHPMFPPTRLRLPARPASTAWFDAPASVPIRLAPLDPPDRVDAWIAEDKVRHFTTSFAATAIGFGGARLALDAEAARGVAVGVALVLGIGKEFADARAGRWFSLKDLVWDAAGVALGAALISQTR